MDLKNLLKRALTILLLTAFISACDSGGGVAPDKTPPIKPVITQVSSDASGIITITGTAEKGSKVTVVFPDGTSVTVTADDNGNFSATSGSAQPSGDVKVTSEDDSGNVSDPTFANEKSTLKALYLATGRMPELAFKPSVGVNTESPQGDGAVGQPMPFVDIFRTARPFGELSGDVTLDENGWPTQFGAGRDYARTKVLEGTLKDAIPSGTYTLIYEGEGTIQLGGRRENIHALEGQKGFTFDWNPIESDDPQANALTVVIRDITPESYIKNIQIIMPGGRCIDNTDFSVPFIRATSAEDCPNNTNYQTFVEHALDTPRNNLPNLIFNPDYLSFLREFKVIRMMNLMEASHGKGNSCPSNDGCPNRVDEWANRAKLSDAVWGGTPESDYTLHNGVPVEVMVALANTLDRDIWINMPHTASDDYVSQYADYVYTHLFSDLNVYLEYSNEIWNSGFLGHDYVVTKGLELNLDTIPEEFQRYCGDDLTQEEKDARRCGKYFAGLRYYSQRSVEIFDFWENKFNNSGRLIHILGTSQGDKVRTEEMIKFVGQSKIDAIAMAPYFYGCTFRPEAGLCSDAPIILPEATTVDDVFAIIDQDNSTHSLSGTIALIQNQLEVTSRNNIKLVTYEGGQHLTPTVMKITGDTEQQIEAEKARFRTLFKEANRDPRMKQRYQTLLNEWKNLADDGATLFTLYTLPQSFYRHGNWGLKEHLNKSRQESPKYDGVMTFQEAVGQCWWDGCE